MILVVSTVNLFTLSTPYPHLPQRTRGGSHNKLVLLLLNNSQFIVRVIANTILLKYSYCRLLRYQRGAVVLALGGATKVLP